MSSGLFEKPSRYVTRAPIFPPPLTSSLYQLILLADCPQQFHYRQLARGGEVWSCCKGAAREQRSGACMPTRTAGHFWPKQSQTSQGRLRQVGGGGVHKLADETLLAIGWTSSKSQRRTERRKTYWAKPKMKIMEHSWIYDRAQKMLRKKWREQIFTSLFWAILVRSR